MIYENPIIFKKLVRSKNKEKLITKSIIKSIIFRKFVGSNVVLCCYEDKKLFGWSKKIFG